MKSILNQIFHSNVNPIESVVFHSKEYLLSRESIKKEREYLSASMSPEDRKHMVKYEDSIFQVAMKNDYEHFVYGFKLGAQLMREVYVEEDSTTA